MSEWQIDQQSHRHFSHRSQGKTRKRGGGDSAKGGIFEPRNMLGEYQISCSFFAQLCQHSLDEDHSTEDEYPLRLFIHELVPTGDAYFATFDLGVVKGVMLIAGSRRALRNVSSAAGKELHEHQHEKRSIHEDASGEQIADGTSLGGSAPRNDNDDEDSDVESLPESFAFERPPELDRPHHAFEKNTFRTPKWFAQWRGRWTGTRPLRRSSPDDSNERSFTPTDCDNRAHFEFTTAACRQFDATITCPSLGAVEMPFQGWKINKRPPRFDGNEDWASYDD